MITTYVCEEPCNNITVRGNKLLKIENIEYAITSVTYDDTDRGDGVMWLSITLQKTGKMSVQHMLAVQIGES